ncbi:MAG: nucleotidyltransferase domain-containing protein [Nanoarchaeota archaeon]
MNLNSKIMAYAIDFISFFMQKTQNNEIIKEIILFGSVARGEANESSDVDIFINVTKENNRLKSEIKKIMNDFYDSIKYKNYWHYLEIKNEIKPMVGELNNWKELKPSILANGLILYGKYKADIKEGIHKTFFIWENIKPNSKRVLFNKQLLGYKQNNKFYNGILQKYNGEKLGKGCIVVPIEHSILFHNLFKKYRIAVRIKKVLEY